MVLAFVLRLSHGEGIDGYFTVRTWTGDVDFGLVRAWKYHSSSDCAILLLMFCATVHSPLGLLPAGHSGLGRASVWAAAHWFKCGDLWVGSSVTGDGFFLPQEEDHATNRQNRDRCDPQVAGVLYRDTELRYAKNSW